MKRTNLILKQKLMQNVQSTSRNKDAPFISMGSIEYFKNGSVDKKMTFGVLSGENGFVLP